MFNIWKMAHLAERVNKLLRCSKCGPAFMVSKCDLVLQFKVTVKGLRVLQETHFVTVFSFGLIL